MLERVEDAELDAAPVRIGVTLTTGQYRQLHGIALDRWRQRYDRRVLPDDSVGQLVAQLTEYALEQLAEAARERRVVEANRRHVRAVPEPWPTGPWSQDEVDHAVTAAQAGQTVDVIAGMLCRQQREVRELLQGFGLLRRERTVRRSA